MLRRLLALALVASALVAVAAQSVSVPGDFAVLEAPQVDDVTLLQMTHTTSSSVSALSASLASALSQQAELVAELDAQTKATHGALANADAEQMAELEEQAFLQTQTTTALKAGSDAETASEIEAEFEAEAETEVEADADAETETEVEAQAESDADTDADSEVDAELLAEAEAEAEAQIKAEAESKAEAEASAEADAELEAENEAAEADSFPRFSAKEKDDSEAEEKTEEKEEKEEKKEDKKEKNEEEQKEDKEEKDEEKEEEKPRKKHGRKHKRKHSKKAKKEVYRKSKVLRAERKHPRAAPDAVHLPGNQTLLKTWVVSPNLRLEVPKRKPKLKHSKERVLTQKQADKYTRRPALHPRRLSETRRAFLRLNPEQRAAKLRARNLSPVAAFEHAFRLGKFPQLRFDPPTSVTRHTVVQHLTVRHTAPTVRQRAEVSALRAATRTLRRINAKRREFKRALRALRLARNDIQGQIHKHHVQRALAAKKAAKLAERRAAWSALLRHRRLRKELMRSISRALRKGDLKGAQRREAIAALIKRNISPEQRARLHQFIRQGRHGRKAARHHRRGRKGARRHRRGRKGARRSHRRGRKGGRRHRRSRRSQRKASGKKLAKVGAPQNKLSTTTVSLKASGKRVGSVKPAAASAAPVISAKDQSAIDALIKRIRAAIDHPDTPKRATSIAGKKLAAAQKKVGVAQAKTAATTVSAKAASAKRVGAVKTQAKTAATTVSAKAASAKRVGAKPQAKTAATTVSAKAASAKRVGSAAPIAVSKKKKVTVPVRFQQLASAAEAANEAEASALAELGVETELEDEKNAPLLHTEAEVQAALETTDDFMAEYGL